MGYELTLKVYFGQFERNALNLRGWCSYYENKTPPLRLLRLLRLTGITGFLACVYVAFNPLAIAFNGDAVQATRFTLLLDL